MSTQQQIDDPGQWRVGDMFEGWYQGHAFSGPIWQDGPVLRVGSLGVRLSNGWRPDDITGHVTRTVEPIPEPTEPWALVKFADGAILRRGTSSGFWIDSDGDAHSWTGAQDVYGTPVAVSLPHWSDEVDGPGVRAAKLADAVEAGARANYARHYRTGMQWDELDEDRKGRERDVVRPVVAAVRDLLAEGGEA